MARIVNSTFAPIVECVIRTHFEDGTTDDKILSTDEVVEDFRYVENGEITNNKNATYEYLEEKNYYISHLTKKNDLALKYNYFKNHK